MINDAEMIVVAIDHYYKNDDKETFFAGTVALEDNPPSTVLVQKVPAETFYNGIAIALKLTLAKVAYDTRDRGESLDGMDGELRLAIVENKGVYGSSVDALFLSCIKMFWEVRLGRIELDQVESSFKQESKYRAKYNDIKAAIVYSLLSIAGHYEKFDISFRQAPLKDHIFDVGRAALDEMWKSQPKTRLKKFDKKELMDLMNQYQ